MTNKDFNKQLETYTEYYSGKFREYDERLARLIARMEMIEMDAVSKANDREHAGAGFFAGVIVCTIGYFFAKWMGWL